MAYQTEHRHSRRSPRVDILDYGRASRHVPSPSSRANAECHSRTRSIKTIAFAEPCEIAVGND